MGRGGWCGGLPPRRRPPLNVEIEISGPIHPFPTPPPPAAPIHPFPTSPPAAAPRGEERTAAGGEPLPPVLPMMVKEKIHPAGRGQNSLKRPQRLRKTPPEERPRKGKAADGDRLMHEEGPLPPPRRLNPRRKEKTGDDDAPPGFSSCTSQAAHTQIQILYDDVPPRVAAAAQGCLHHWGGKRPRSAVGSRDDWSGLDDGPAGLIAERVLAGGDVADYVRFRAVCRPWRRCCADPRIRAAVLEDSRLHPRRWVMLLGEGEKLTAAGAPHCTRRRFLNVSTGQCVQVEIPELRDHGVLRSSTEGLLLLVAKGGGAVRLLNPLTRQDAELPPIPPGLDITKAHIGQVSQDNAGLVDDGRVLLYNYEQRGSILAFAKPGDERWVLVKVTSDRLMPTMSFAGRFYGVTFDSVMVVDTTARGEDAKLAVAARLATPIRPMMNDTAHLVEIAGELMLVHHRMRCVRGDFKKTCKLYRVNLATGKATPAAARGRAIFVGRCRSLAVCPQVFPSLSTNTVYAAQYFNMATYHLRDGSVETFKCQQSGLHPWSIVDCLAAYVSG